MKKRYLILVGLLALTLAAAGCGKKKETETTPTEASATPAPEVTKAVDMVDMQQTTDDLNIKNIMGEKTATASKVIFVNNTGDDVEAVYIREHTDDGDDEEDSWGEDLINGRFIFGDEEKSLYYFQANTSGESNKMTVSYDIRITYTEEGKNECFFRDIPLGTISQITLCMDGDDEDAIPYAKYLTGSSKQEKSTLNDVKKRLGMMDGDDSMDDSQSDSDSQDTSSSDSDSDDNSNGAGQNTDDNGGYQEPTDGEDPGTTEDPGDSEDPGDTQPTEPENPGGGEDLISVAEQYIGQSLGALEGACGSPQGSSYEDDPETGKTGFHYYSNFTVSTTVDENGNEIVAGIW